MVQVKFATDAIRAALIYTSVVCPQSLSTAILAMMVCGGLAVASLICCIVMIYVRRTVKKAGQCCVTCSSAQHMRPSLSNRIWGLN